MAQPPGFQNSEYPNYVCRLNKAIYGLKQSPRTWYTTFSTFLQRQGFQVSTADPSLLLYKTSTTQTYLLLYVDDILITGNNTDFIHHLTAKLHQQFHLKILGPVGTFLGINIERTPTGFLLTQTAYLHSILHTAGLQHSKAVSTPLSLKSNQLPDDSPPFSQPTHYRRLAGSLQYLTITRPDIAYAVNLICQHMHNPTSHHFQLLKRILRYLQATPSYGLPVVAGKSTLTAYSDADWAGDTLTRRSTTGYCFYLGDTLISWKVQKQKTVARSSTEAEYRALAAATTEAIWLRRLFAEFNIHLAAPTALYCDNTSAISIATNPIFHARTKHVEIDFYFVRDQVNRKQVTIQHIPTTNQVADILTKPLPAARFNILRDKLTVTQRAREFEGG